MKKHYYFYFILSVLLLLSIGCSSDDDTLESEQFIVANVNGVDFHSDSKNNLLGFTRILTPAGRINLHVSALSADGNILELMVDNFQGPGKYYFGDNYYNASWVKFQIRSSSEAWSVKSSEALNQHVNFIEITSIRDNYIEGKISCDQLINETDGVLGIMSGEFGLVIND